MYKEMSALNSYVVVHHFRGVTFTLAPNIISFPPSYYEKSSFQAAQYIGEICRYLLSMPPGPADQSHQVKVMTGNGLRPQIWQQFVERFAVERVVEFYGATEGNSNLGKLIK